MSTATSFATTTSKGLSSLDLSSILGCSIEIPPQLKNFSSALAPYTPLIAISSIPQTSLSSRSGLGQFAPMHSPLPVEPKYSSGTASLFPTDKPPTIAIFGENDP